MKKTYFVLILFYSSAGLQAQTWDEWFNQKKTQLTYLVAQITANQVYLTELEKGYALTKDGLKAINDIKQGDFHLHNDYFSSLNKVPAGIANSPASKDMLTVQSRITRELAAARVQIAGSGALTGNELLYYDKVSANLLQECNKTMNDLSAVLTNGALTMTADERIRRIDQLSVSMQEHLQYEHLLTRDTWALCLQRKGDKTAVRVSRKLLGLP